MSANIGSNAKYVVRLPGNLFLSDDGTFRKGLKNAKQFTQSELHAKFGDDLPPGDADMTIGLQVVRIETRMVEVISIQPSESEVRQLELAKVERSSIVLRDKMEELIEHAKQRATVLHDDNLVGDIITRFARSIERSTRQ